MNTKKFDHIISLGQNCELGFHLRNKFGFVESSLFTWASVGAEDLGKVILNPGLIFSGGIEEWQNCNMWKCMVTNIAFHGQKRPEQLKNERGERDLAKIQEQKEEVISRVRHLGQKFQTVASSQASKLYILILRPDFLPLNEGRIKNYVSGVFEALQKTAKNFALLVILHEKYNTRQIKELENDRVFVRFLHHFAPIDKANETELLDLKSSHVIFEEFQPSVIQQQNKVYKYDQPLKSEPQNSRSASFTRRIYAALKSVFNKYSKN